MSEKFKVEINTALLNIYTFGFRLKLTNKKLWFKWSEAGLFTRFLIVLWYHVSNSWRGSEFNPPDKETLFCLHVLDAIYVDF